MSSVLELVGELRGVVDRLLACTDECGPADLHDAVVALHTERDRLAVAAADVVHRWGSSDGWRADGTLRAPWTLARDTHSSDEHARAELRRASALQRMPLVRAAVLE